MNKNDSNFMTAIMMVCIILGGIMVGTLIHTNNYVLGDAKWQCTQAVIVDGVPECVQYNIKEMNND